MEETLDMGTGECVLVLSLSCAGCGMVVEALSGTIIPALYMRQPYYHGMHSTCGGRLAWQVEPVDPRVLTFDDVQPFSCLIIRCNAQTPFPPKGS